MRAPRREWDVVRADAWNEAAGALVDPGGMWYWESREPPDRDRVAGQHRALVAALRAEGVEVVFVEGDGPAHLTRPIYTRDPLLTVPGGAIIGRMAPAMRRGEEPLVSRAVAARRHADPAHDHRHRARRGRELREAAADRRRLRHLVPLQRPRARASCETRSPTSGIELIVVPMVGWSIHLDGHLGMLSPDAALVEVNGLPYWFLDRLRALGIEPVPCPEGEEWAINSLAVAPGRILMCDGYPRTRELLERRGIEVVADPVRRDPEGRRRHPLLDDGIGARSGLTEPASMPKLPRQCRTRADQSEDAHRGTLRRTRPI